jgi:hypothetical protein
MHDLVSFRLNICDELLASLANGAIEKPAKSELTAALEALRETLGNMKDFVVQLQLCLASEPAPSEFHCGAKTYSFSLEGTETLYRSFGYFHHDLGHQLMDLDIHIRESDRVPQNMRRTTSSSMLQWYVLRAKQIINLAADAPISVEELVREVLNHEGLSNARIELPDGGIKGLVRGQFKLALKEILAALGEGSRSRPSRMRHLRITTSLTDIPSERQLQIAVTIREKDDCPEVCDAINGIFKPNAESPFFELYVASRMLLDSGANVLAPLTSPHLTIIIPFPEVG